MSIPEQQLKTWSHQGPTTGASKIYQRIRNALNMDAELAKHRVEVFLQGSYRNHTNIYGDSDVDVVVMLNETYMPNYEQLDSQTRGLMETRADPATYQFEHFRRDVAAAIRQSFPNHNITEGGKSIKIPRTPNNIPADIVPCLEYRCYTPALGLLNSPGYSPNPNYIEGIWLKDARRNQTCISFPKQHYDNGVAKTRRANEVFKPTVRIFKNANHCMESRGLLASKAATSYGIECLLYNAPDSSFTGSHQETLIAILDWLSAADLTNFVCQNGLQKLFAADRWNIKSAKAFINALIQLWNSWQ